MRGLLPRSLPSLIPYNRDLSPGLSWSLFCGDMRRLSPGRLCRSSGRPLAKSGYRGKFSALPLGSARVRLVRFSLEAQAVCPGQVQVIEGSYWERQI